MHVTRGGATDTVAGVDVELDDRHVETITYDLQTGTLTPASPAALGARAVPREREDDPDVPRRSRA